MCAAVASRPGVIVVVGMFSMATPQSTSDRTLIRRRRACPNCGAQVPPHLTHCWVCREDLRKADRPALKVNQFSILTFFLVTALLGVILAVFRLSIVAGVVLLAVAIPATARTVWTAQIWKAAGDRSSLGDLLDTFVGSLGATIAAWALGIAVFTWCCCCAGFVSSEWLLLPALPLGLVTTAYCFWILRP